MSASVQDLIYLLRRSTEAQVVAAAGLVYAAGTQGFVTALSLNAGVDAASVELRVTGAGGAVLWRMKAPAGDSRTISFPSGLKFTDGLYVSFPTGTTPELALTGVSDVIAASL